jgi:hypothetical protein
MIDVIGKYTKNKNLPRSAPDAPTSAPTLNPRPKPIPSPRSNVWDCRIPQLPRETTWRCWSGCLQDSTCWNLNKEFIFRHISVKLSNYAITLIIFIKTQKRRWSISPASSRWRKRCCQSRRRAKWLEDNLACTLQANLKEKFKNFR